MIKNRIRTAALAGAIAVATGVSGLTVPAMAQDVTAPQSFNNEDGSAAVDVEAQNITEDQLQERTNLTAGYLETWREGGDLQAIVSTYLDLGGDGFDPSEEAAEAAFEQARLNASAELARAAQNITDARASIAFALEADQAAEDAWEAFEAAVTAAADELNPLIEAVNDAKTYEGEEFADLPTIDGSNPVAGWNALLALQTTVDQQWDTAGEWNIDETDDRYINRNHMAALEALKGALDGQVESIAPIRQAALDANREAQLSDVLVRQLYLERATAQRDTLRVVEGIFSVAERYIELYENDELVGNTTLRSLYFNVLDNLFRGLENNLAFLDQADSDALEGHQQWWSDLQNNNDGERYFERKLEFASQNYERIFQNGQVWQNELQRVELIDQSIIDARQAELDRLERERIQAELEAQRHQDYLDAIRDLNNTPAPGDDNDDDANNGSSEVEGSSVGGLGIFAVLAGVIGLIAAAFPFVSNFLNLNR